MTVSETDNTGRTPLEQIQRTEAEAAQQIRAAQEAAQTRLKLARKRAVQLKHEAVDIGRREGEVACKESISKAMVEAEGILIQARKQTEELHRNNEQYIDTMVSHAVKIVIGLHEEASQHEP